MERSHVRILWADPDESKRICACGNALEISDQLRPKYQNISRKDPLGLLATIDPETSSAPVADASVREELAELRDALKAATDEIARLGSAPSDPPKRTARASAGSEAA